MSARARPQADRACRSAAELRLARPGCQSAVFVVDGLINGRGECEPARCVPAGRSAALASWCHEGSYVARVRMHLLAARAFCTWWLQDCGMAHEGVF